MAKYRTYFFVAASALSVLSNAGLVVFLVVESKMTEQNIQEVSAASYYLGRMTERAGSFPVKEDIESLPTRLQLVDVSRTSAKFRLRGLKRRLLIVSVDDAGRFNARMDN